MEVERGPGCLLIKLGASSSDASDVSSFAEALWSLMEQHLVARIVIDLSAVTCLNRHMLAQLVRLYRRIREHDGMMRLTGLSADSQALVRLHGLNNHLPIYSNLEEAMMGQLPHKPR
jgi:anti-anti-sigma factor